MFLNWNTIWCIITQYQRSKLWQWFQRKVEVDRGAACIANMQESCDSDSLCSHSEIHFKQVPSWTSLLGAQLHSRGIVQTHSSSQQKAHQLKRQNKTGKWKWKQNKAEWLPNMVLVLVCCVVQEHYTNTDPYLYQLIQFSYLHSNFK